MTGTGDRFDWNKQTRPVHLVEDEIDICIAKKDWIYQSPNLNKLSIVKISKGLFASDNYIKTYGKPNTLEALSNHRLITLGQQAINQEVWELNQHEIFAKGILHFNNPESAIDAIKAGLGIGYLPLIPIIEETM